MLAELAVCAALAAPPNFVVVFADDLGYADVGCYGAEGFETPHLDQMAEDGVRFTDFYVAQAVCSASRAALLTGCYSNRVSVFGAYGPKSTNGLHPDEVTIADMLKPLGYATACIGKWHLGNRREFLPLQQGFDVYLGIPYSNDMWPVDYDGTPLPAEHWKSKHPPLPLYEGNEQILTFDDLDSQGTITTRYAEAAVSFIDEHADEPFFLYVPHSMPHVPLGVSEKFAGRSEQGMYGDVIMEIDWSVGEILAALERNGLTDNTFVLFTSDNGPWLNYGNHAGSVGPLREGKGTMWEGGARVPAIAKWPGRIPAGTVAGGIAGTIDILPTIAQLAGAELPERPIDGVSLVSVLEDPDESARESILFFYGRKLEAVRQGRWKLHVPHDYRSYVGVEPGNDGYPGPYAKGRTEVALFDLESDIGETTDVQADYPEVVERLMAIAEAARAELEPGGTGVRPPGVAETD